MSRTVLRWGVPSLVLLGSLGLAGWPALAQYGGQPSAGELDRAKEMAALIEQGQMNLRDATAMAEKHCKGTALEARCTIEGAEPQPQPVPAPGEPDRPRGPSLQKAQPEGKRLVYEVSCFVKDQLQTVQVDGLSKKVLDASGQK